MSYENYNGYATSSTVNSDDPPVLKNINLTLYMDIPNGV